MFDFNLKTLSFVFLILSIVFVVNASTSISTNYKNNFKNESEVKVKSVFDAIFYQDGYMNSTEQPYCSDAQTLTDITAHRLIKCTGIRNILLKEATAGLEANPAESYLTFMDMYKNGCDFYFKSESTTTMRVFITCDLGISKISAQLIEQDWMNFFLSTYPNEFILTEVEYEAIDIDTATGGSINDGKIRLKFEK